MIRYAILALLAAPLSAAAAEDYRCTISRVEQGAEGSADTLKRMRDGFIGKQFSVERRTGLMAGTLKNSYTTKPVVIDIGSSENAFKAVTTVPRATSPAGSALYVLVIHEWVDGPKKPFTFFDVSTLYFGFCEHF